MPIVTQFRDCEVGVISYGSKTLRRPNPQYEFDLRNFRDPQGQSDLRKLDPRSGPVREYIKQDPRFETLLNLARIHVKDAIGSKRSAYISLAFMDHHGKLLAPAVAEEVASTLSSAGYKVMVEHYGLSAK